MHIIFILLLVNQWFPILRGLIVSPLICFESLTGMPGMTAYVGFLRYALLRRENVSLFQQLPEQLANLVVNLQSYLAVMSVEVLEAKKMSVL